MSGVVSSVKKVFKKVVKVAKKVLPIALAAVAIYFTAGAALGVAGTAGGWGGAVSGLVSNLGLSSTLSSVVIGGITQAGYGAVLGGGIAALTGGDISKGLLTGATTGAVTGGVLGGFGAPTDPFAGIGEGSATAASGATSLNAPITPVTTAPLGPITPGAAQAAAPAAAPATGLLSKVGGFVQNNPIASGLAIQGLGTGISGFAQADADKEIAQLIAQQKAADAAQIAANFSTSGAGLLTGTGLPSGSVQDTIERPTPAQQFSPATALAKSQGAMWRYNPESGQIELS